MTDRPDAELEQNPAPKSRVDPASMLDFFLWRVPDRPRLVAEVVVALADVVAAMPEGQLMTSRFVQAVADVVAAMPSDYRRRVVRKVDVLAANPNIREAFDLPDPPKTSAMTDQPDLEQLERTLIAKSREDRAELLTSAIAGLPPDRRARVVADVVPALADRLAVSSRLLHDRADLTASLGRVLAEVVAAMPSDQRRVVLRRSDELAASLADRPAGTTSDQAEPTL